MWDIVRDAFTSATNFGACIFSLLCRLPYNVCHGIVVMMLWCLRRRRNDKVWSGELNEVNVIVQLTHEALFQWNYVRTNDVRGAQQVQQPNPVCLVINGA